MARRSVDYVSPATFQNQLCKRLIAERNEFVRNVDTLAASQRKSATDDAVLTGVTLDLFWPAAIAFRPGKRSWIDVDHANTGERQVRLTNDFDAQMTSAMLLSLITSVGVSEEFYIVGARTAASQMYYLTRAELSDWGVETRAS